MSYCKNTIYGKSYECSTEIESNTEFVNDGIYTLYMKRKGRLYFRNYYGMKVSFWINDLYLPKQVVDGLKYGVSFTFEFETK